MEDVFRIIERFKLTGRGTIYIIKLSRNSVLNLGDILFDLHGNKFKVSGIEICGRYWNNIPPIEELPRGIKFEQLSGVEVEGNILVRDLTNINFLFCNHPLYPHKVDEDYEEEYQSARIDHTCALFSYEEFLQGNLKLYGEDISGLTIYRGWMLKPEMYKELYEALEKRGIYLINSPEAYKAYHLLPDWYNDFKGETAESVWTEGNNIEDVLQISKKLEGSYIIKDYVKSRKHEWYDACFINNINDKKNLERIANNFINRQGENLTGGVVLRKFEPLRQIGYHPQSGMPLSEEYCVFVFAGRILAVDNYWIEKSGVNITADEYRWIESIASKLKSNFVSVDLARKEDSTLIIMELGDGQVSGLQQLQADVFYGAFKENQKHTLLDNK